MPGPALGEERLHVVLLRQLARQRIEGLPQHVIAGADKRYGQRLLCRRRQKGRLDEDPRAVIGGIGGHFPFPVGSFGKEPEPPLARLAAFRTATVRADPDITRAVACQNDGEF
jgi:hypothetical protein